MALKRIAIAGASLGPAMAGVPVTVLSPAMIESGGVMRPAARSDLTPARLWIAKGLAWHGPFRGWRAARRALEALGAGIACEALQRGRGSVLGAYALAGGWRWRLAWGNDFPPGRFNE